MRKSLYLGTLVFSLQLLLVLIISPEKSVSQAWFHLATHWDSEWYAAIAHYGYINTNGPQYSGLLNANVVFFPGYPYLARLLVGCGIDANVALLLVAQTAAWMFWWLLFYILRSLSWQKQCHAALLIAVFPTSWFLLMGYSESVFILCCCAMLWWVTTQRWGLSGISGMLMTATRLIGLPVLAAPLLSAIMIKHAQFKTAWQAKQMSPVTQGLLWPGLMIPIGALGCLGFFVYCVLHFDSWHLYFDMERIHWKGTADPWFLLKKSTWLPPPWGYSLDLAPALPNILSKILPFDVFRMAAYTFSQMLVPLMLWFELFHFVRLCRRYRDLDQTSLTWYLASLLMLLFSCFSLSTRYYESMSRCLFPVWILLIISDALHPTQSFFIGQKKRIVLIILSFGFWLQMLNRFLLGWWVA